MDRLLSPNSIAVVGASPTAGKIGNVLMRNFAGFSGAIYPVHLTAREVLGRTAYPSLRAISQPVDLALLAIPQSAVLAALEDCVAAGIGAAIVYSGGWAETGDAGHALQSDMQRFARAANIRILGPNTSGFVRPESGIFATFVAGIHQQLRAGSLAIVAQSGGVNLSLCFLAQNEGIGVRLGIGLGNACDVGLADVLNWLADDQQTSVVALAIEGIADGRGLVSAIERLADKCPVVALTAGRSEIAQFAKSHTGVLTGSYRVKRAALAQAGAVVVDDLTEMIDAIKALGAFRLPAKQHVGVGVVTGQAGPGLLLTDALRSRTISIPALSSATRDRLKQLLPPLTYQENPVDTGRPGETFTDVLKTVRNSDGIDVLAVSLLHEPDAVDPASVLSEVSPTILCSLGPSELMVSLQDTLAAHRIPLFPTPDRAATAVSAVVRDARHQWRRRETNRSTSSITTAYTPPSGRWDEETAKELLKSVGIVTPERVVCDTHDDAMRALSTLGPPVVVKILNPHVLHKTDAGGVHLNVRTVGEMAVALTAIDRTRGSRYLIERMIASGPELILGARRDKSFGAMIALGAGGTGVEVDDDVAIRLAPVSDVDARDMLGELRVAKRYRGHRGAIAVDEDALAVMIQSLGQVIAAREDIAELEINPLRVTKHGLIALDALVVAR